MLLFFGNSFIFLTFITFKLYFNFLSCDIIEVFPLPGGPVIITFLEIILFNFHYNFLPNKINLSEFF